MKALIFLNFFFVILCYSIIGQININGKVTDSDLSPINNALVEIIDNYDSTNYYSQATDAEGNFQISNIILDAVFNENIQHHNLILRNYPNPFNPSTIIHYELPSAESIQIIIYDILGRRVRNLVDRHETEGVHQEFWDGRNDHNRSVSAGIYLCQLLTKNNSIVHKMILLDGGTTTPMYFNRSLSKQNLSNTSNTQNEFTFSVLVSGDNILNTTFSNLRCKSDTTINLIVPKILEKITIGSEGGTIETDGIKLVIPSDALNESAELQLGVDINADIFDNKLSNIYRIDGLPNIIHKPIKVYLQLNNIPSDTVSLGIGSHFVDLISQDQFISFDTQTAYDSSGYLLSELEPSLETNLSKSLNSNRNKSIQYFVALISPGKVKSSDGNFRLKFPKSLKEFIPDIDDQLVDAINEYTNLGFSRKENGIDNNPYWPLKVKIENKNTLKYVMIEYVNGKPEIIINRKYVVNEELENLNYHLGKSIYFCFVLQDYSKYDAFNNYHFWLHYSLFTWLGHMFTNEIDHIPPSFKLLKNLKHGYKHIFYGLHYEWPFSNIKGAIEHGVSLSPLIQYFAKNAKYSNSIVSKIYNNLELKVPALNAIIKSIDEEENIWWEHFLTRYISGKVYNVMANNFYDGILDSYSMDINDENSFENTFSLDYENLSANIYRININNTEFNNDKRFRFTLKEFGTNASNVNVSIWGINDKNLEFIAGGYDVVLQENINTLLQKKYAAILLCVSNSYAESPFNEKVKINLNVTLYEQEKYYKKCTLNFKIAGKYLYDGTNTNLNAMGYWEFYKGVNIDGDFFTAYLDSTDSYINEYDKEVHWSQNQYLSGNINYNNGDTTITNIYGELQGLSYLQDFNRNEVNTSIRLIDFPLQKTGRGKNWIEWKVEGKDIDLSKLIVRDRTDGYTIYSGKSVLEFQSVIESDDNFIKLVFYE